jgi:hypothetical protein
MKAAPLSQYQPARSRQPAYEPTALLETDAAFFAIRPNPRSTSRRCSRR